jgi:flavin reductase (DIM6/NTAB) family NADH-FMN oxidoreductase RutF
MRGWPTGVAVVTSVHNGQRHGMTVNSLASVSLEPPMVTISLANQSRTRGLVMASGVFGVTLLDDSQQHIADVFSGKEPEEDRFDDLELFMLQTGVPLLRAGRGFLDCRVVHTYPMPNSTIFVGEVQAAHGDLERSPLVYLNRGYHQVEK